MEENSEKLKSIKNSIKSCLNIQTSKNSKVISNKPPRKIEIKEFNLTKPKNPKNFVIVEDEKKTYPTIKQRKYKETSLNEIESERSRRLEKTKNEVKQKLKQKVDRLLQQITRNKF